MSFSPGKFIYIFLTVAFLSLVCSGTWVKDSRFRPASLELRCPSLPPLSVTFICAQRCDAPGSARRPQRLQTRSMATAEPRTHLNKSTQHTCNKHTPYLYIPYIYSSRCMVSIPIFIYSNCSALLSSGD